MNYKLIFAVPLRSKKSSLNWGGVQRNLNNTLKSIFNQTGDVPFKCIIACTDIPDIETEYGQNLEIIQLKLPEPHGHEECCKDKLYKLTSIAKRTKQILKENSNSQEGIFFFPIDADDLIHKDIAKYVSEHFNENGFISDWGYVRYFSEWPYKRLLKREPYLFGFCGSCNIFKLMLNDLPDDLESYKTFKPNPDRYFFQVNHGCIPGEFEKNGRKFAILPFATTVYMLGTKENLSNIDPAYKNNKNVVSRLLPKIHLGFWLDFLKHPSNYSIVNKKINAEYGYVLKQDKD